MVHEWILGGPGKLGVLSIPKQLLRPPEGLNPSTKHITLK